MQTENRTGPCFHPLPGGARPSGGAQRSVVLRSSGHPRWACRACLCHLGTCPPGGRRRFPSHSPERVCEQPTLRTVCPAHEGQAGPGPPTKVCPQSRPRPGAPGPSPALLPADRARVPSEGRAGKPPENASDAETCSPRLDHGSGFIFSFYRQTDFGGYARPSLERPVPSCRAAALASWSQHWGSLGTKPKARSRGQSAGS